MSALRVATKATLPATEGGLKASADAYFAVAALVSALCACVYAYVLPRLPAVRQGRQAAALEAALHDYQQQQQQDEPGASLLTPLPPPPPLPQYSPLKPVAGAHQPGGSGLHSPALDLELSVEEPPPYELQELVGGVATPPRQRFTPGGGGPVHHASPSKAMFTAAGGASPAAGSDGWHTPPLVPAAGARSGSGAALSAASVAICIWRPALALTLIYT